jgi:glycine cleavage system pyridoxal-binding protein P
MNACCDLSQVEWGALVAASEIRGLLQRLHSVVTSDKGPPLEQLTVHVQSVKAIKARVRDVHTFGASVMYKHINVVQVIEIRTRDPQIHAVILERPAIDRIETGDIEQIADEPGSRKALARNATLFRRQEFTPY